MNDVAIPLEELGNEVDEVKLKSDCSTYLEDKIKIDDLEKENAELKRLLAFWVNDFYYSYKNPNKYEDRHNALVESERILKE